MGTRTAYLVAGLAYGDEGKGATVDWLCRRHNAGLVVRYNGGAQAGHNVISADGHHHTFSQFGAGMFTPRVRTHLSRFMLVNPLAMMREERHLRDVGVLDAWNRTTVEAGCVIVTPFHRAVNRLLEWSRGPYRHGSCGMGVGQARSYQLKYGDQVLYAGDLKNRATTLAKLQFLQRACAADVDGLPYVLPKTLDVANELGLLRSFTAPEVLAEEYRHWPAVISDETLLDYMMKNERAVIFEGAQGVLLDETHGESPYNTWTDTTFNNAMALCRKYEGQIVRIGVLRTYFTRHGPGPFLTEDAELTKTLQDPHNQTGEFQGPLRYGRFDVAAALRSLKIIGGVDGIALNHLDENMEDPWQYCVGYIQDVLETPVTIRSFGPTAADRIERPVTAEAVNQ